MNTVPGMICLALISLVHLTEQTRLFNTRYLNLGQSQYYKYPENTNNIFPEESRQLSIFRNSHKKFVVSPEPYYRPPTHYPFAMRTPLMRNFFLLNQQPSLMDIAVEDETRRPIMNTQLFYPNKFAVLVEPVSEEKSLEINEDNSDESYEKQNNDKELKTTTAHTANMDYFNLKDFMFPFLEPTKVSSENIKDERFSDTADAINNSEDDEVPDLEEFIFLDPLKNPIETEKVSSEVQEVPEEYVTTETSKEPNFFRRKRSSNIIVEENLGTTMAGHKYTWKDTKLNDNLAFKNINS